MATASTTRILEDIFTCCLCFEPYNTNVNIPKGLPCQHTFCAPCLDKLIRAIHENDEEPQCPTCKARFSVPKEGARKLPTNLTVQQMIELKMHQAAPTQDSVGKPEVKLKHHTCKEHPYKHVIMVCVECETEFCMDCVKALHKSNHSKHELEDIEIYLSNYKNEFQKLKLRSQNLPELYDQAQKAADENLGNTKRERDSEIDQQAQNAIQLVQTWQKEQKNVYYWTVCAPAIDLHSSDKYGGDINSDVIKSFSAKIDMLGNAECNKLPSMKGIKGAILDLNELERNCCILGDTVYEKAPIEPIQVVIGKQKK